MSLYEYGVESMLYRWITKVGDLSPAEQQTLLLAAMGYRSREIAQILQVSPRTTESHMSAIYQKMGVRCDPQALAKILELAAREALEEVSPCR